MKISYGTFIQFHCKNPPVALHVINQSNTGVSPGSINCCNCCKGDLEITHNAREYSS